MHGQDWGMRKCGKDRWVKGGKKRGIEEIVENNWQESKRLNVKEQKEGLWEENIGVKIDIGDKE